MTRLPLRIVATVLVALISPWVQADTRADFNALEKAFLAGLAEHFPVTGTALGEHRFDHRLPDVSATGRKRQAAWLQARRKDLAALDTAELSATLRIDAELLAHELDASIWRIETLQEWSWNPLYYTAIAGNGLYTLLARDFAPLPTRLEALTARLNALPAFFAAARSAMDIPTVPVVHAETALRQHRGLLSIVDALAVPARDQLDESGRVALDAAIDTARNAVAEHATWMETELVPGAEGDFRLGVQLYSQKLRYALNSPYSTAEVRRLAEREYQRTRGAMYELAKKIYAERYPQTLFPDAPSDAYRQSIIRAALEIAYADVPTRDGIVATARASLDTATEFVREKNLVRLPDDPLEIILMPEFRRGIALAYCDSPGPLDKGLKTYYAVSPLPEDWSDEQTAGFLREYNVRSVHNLTIHEAMPGHYLQLAHANEYPSTLRAVLASGPFIEGWAVYAEHVMTAAGYYDADPLMELIQLKWYLRAVINAILDQAVHVDDMTEQAALQLMIEGGFQEEREAAGKWVRAQLTAAQLSTYFVGYQEHAALRREIEALDAENFSLRAYHDEVLSFGSPPVRYVRERMLNARQGD